MTCSYFIINYSDLFHFQTVNHLFFRVSWSTSCQDVYQFEVRIKSECENIYGYRCIKDHSLKTLCSLSEDLNFMGNITNYVHTAMAGTR